MNSCSDISPDPIANSRWTILPLPLTLPEICNIKGRVGDHDVRERPTHEMRVAIGVASVSVQQTMLAHIPDVAWPGNSWSRWRNFIDGLSLCRRAFCGEDP